MENWLKVVLYLFLLVGFLIYLKLSSIEYRGKRVISLKNRIFIALLFPVLFIIVLIFGSLFLVGIFAFIITILLIVFLFSLFNKKRVYKIRF